MCYIAFDSLRLHSLGYSVVTWTPLALSAAPDVLATITKKRVSLLLTPQLARRLGWSEDEPNLSVALGDGENAGWLRVALDEDGVTPEETEDGRLALTLPRSMLPDLQDCRGSPLTWRPADGAIEVRLPTVASGRVPPRRPTLAVNNAVKSGSRPEDDPVSLEVISPPDLYASLHRAAWENGVELTFLSNGMVSVNGKMVEVDSVEALVRAAMEKRTADRQRAG